MNGTEERGVDTSRGAAARIASKLTPAMQQYLEFKSEHEDALLFFRMGDFYELFFEDAEIAASLLDLTLTSRNRNDEHPIPMCGLPWHAMRPYVARLLEAGRKVAICEQLELPEKGIARRKVTRVISPGTNLDEETLAPERSALLAAILERGGAWGVAVTDYSTGEVRATEVASATGLEEELRTLSPAEVVLEAGAGGSLAARVRAVLPRCLVGEARSGADGERSRAGRAASTVATSGGSLAKAAANLLAAHAAATQGGAVAHLREPVLYVADAFLRLDASTRRNLELLEAYDGTSRGALAPVLDRCATGMGRRLLRSWLVRPLADTAAIGERLDAVEALVEDFSRRADVRDLLRRIGDFERLLGRIGGASAGPSARPSTLFPPWSRASARPSPTSPRWPRARAR